MKQGFYAIALMAAAMSAPVAEAQLSFGGTPYGLRKGATLPKPTTHTMPAVDADALLAEDAAREASGVKGPYRFGFNHLVDLNSWSHGVWSDMPNGDRVWRLAIHCPEALSINFEFHDFVVPEGGRVFVYNEAGEVFGGFTAESNPGFTSLGVAPIAGDRITIEYVEPASVEGEGRLRISQVTHAYRDIFGYGKGLGDSGSCNNNVICPEGDPWRDQIRSVAIIVVGGSGACTGQLINNCAEDGTPYFLTANHCLPGGGNVNNWVYRFNWESPSCAQNQNGPTNQTLSGSTVLANSAGSDVALIRINSNPPASYNVYYSGWDRSGTAPTSSVAIHHPSGDVKKISFDNNPATTSTFGGAQCWRIATWEDGTTEPGSSGSGLWNQNGHIIGQLFGGQASCSNNVNDYYGRFDVSWNVLSQHLGSCGPVLEGYDPNNSTTLDYDATLQSINNLPATLCNENTVQPTVTIRNNGNVTLTSLTINYQVTGGGSGTSTWNGSLATGASANHSLGNITLPNGQVTVTVTASQPNGQADQNPSNNTRTQDVSVASPGNEVTLSITLDAYGSETTWQLATNTGTVLFTGGPYQDNQNGTVVNTEWCLATGCYTFTMFDEFGDGICCEYGQGSFRIVDENGTNLVTNNGEFTDDTSNNFCAGVVGIDESDFLSGLTLSPNPTSGELHLWFAAPLEHPTHVVVRDALGRMVDQHNLGAGTERWSTDLSGQAPGIYLVELIADGARRVERVVRSR